MDKSTVIYTNKEKMLLSLLKNKKRELYFFIDKKLINHHKKFIEKLNGKIIFIHASEQQKSLGVIDRLVEMLKKYTPGRDAIFISIGGGATSDLIGLLSSLYMRGVDWYSIPTTLLSMVDASIGGKVGVNHGPVKNLLGNFYPPKKVFICDEFLQSLDKSEFKSGLGEVVKYSILDKSINTSLKRKASNIKLFLENKTQEINIQSLIKKCIEYKINVVTKDPYDWGIRKYLNLGHTFGHAFEIQYGKKHGVAVVLGMIFIFEFYQKTNLLIELNKTIESLGMNQLFVEYEKIKMKLNKNPKKITDLIELDKKKHRGSIKVISPRELGDMEIKTINKKDLEKFLRESN
jgi:3-dehydroquinate synthase